MRLVLTMLGEPVYQEVGSWDRLLFLTSSTSRLGASARSLGMDPAGAQHSASLFLVLCWQHEGLYQWWPGSGFLLLLLCSASGGEALTLADGLKQSWAPMHWQPCP